jgi:dipeptidase
MLVEYPARQGDLIVYWGALASPCMTPYFPLFLEGELPAELSRGGENEEAGGTWWRLKRLQSVIEQDLTTRAPAAREFWRGLETQFAESVARLQDGLRRPVTGASDAAAAVKTTELMAEAFARIEAGIDDLMARFGAA